MNVTVLNLFVEVAQRGSFAAVAKERNIDPSSVSRGIAELEAELGVRLFQRTTRNVTLTEAGDRYLAGVEPLLYELARTHEAALETVGGTRGTLRITASATFGPRCIVPQLKEFCARYPDLRIEALFTDEVVDLFAERVDLAIRLAPAVEGNLVATKLMNTRYRVVASVGYLAAAPPLEVPADIARHRCVMFNLHAFRSRWLFRDSHGAIEEVSVDGDLVLSPAVSLHAAVLEGLGPALLPNWLVDGDIASGALVNVFPTYDVTATTFDTGAWLIYPSRTYLPQKVRVMIDFLKSRLNT
ncbi:LysR family transcriptional regulator [Pseudolysobacter antarcticus]|uniref:LysR family transcriptional regulator n=2 Tax=Pseudolysobacter antarcticus TaxID=2511995 RepID=A0A411HMJ2_9GAMM|nr:LysR family transcriptional regulator [Pseudolysobacter antarcticus]